MGPVSHLGATDLRDLGGGVVDEHSVSWRACPTSLAQEFDLLLVDLDGVVYVGRRAVTGAVESLNRATRSGLRCSYVTNNASRSPAVVAEHLRELGLTLDDEDVVTSAQEGAERLAALVPAGSRVLAIGGPGVAAALVEAGLVPESRYGEGVAGVLQGYGPEVGWRDLAEASYAVSGGAAWVATNPDRTVPTGRGTAPGNGELTAVVQRTTGIDPQVTGKPGPGLFRLAVRRSGGRHPLVIGDRLDTDIAGAVNAGLPALLVLTGVTDEWRLLGAGPEERPTYLARDLAGLWEAQPAVAWEQGWWVCGAARVRVDGGQVGLAPGPRPDDELDVLRATAAAVWSAVDAGAEVDLHAVLDSIALRGG
jgi:glycerol-1-phosphatase